MISPFRNLTEPLIETPRERKAPDGVGMNVRSDGLGTTDGSGRFASAASVPLRGGKRVKGFMAKIVPNYSEFRKRNRVRNRDVMTQLGEVARKYHPHASSADNSDSHLFAIDNQELSIKSFR
jgi:hypothetical protein